MHDGTQNMAEVHAVLLKSDLSDIAASLLKQIHFILLNLLNKYMFWFWYLHDSNSLKLLWFLLPRSFFTSFYFQTFYVQILQVSFQLGQQKVYIGLIPFIDLETASTER